MPIIAHAPLIEQQITIRAVSRVNLRAINISCTNNVVDRGLGNNHGTPVDVMDVCPATLSHPIR